MADILQNEMQDMCPTCPHKFGSRLDGVPITNEQVNDDAKGILRMFRSMAERGERHVCHSHPKLLCAGQSLGVRYVIKGLAPPGKVPVSSKVKGY